MKMFLQIAIISAILGFFIYNKYVYNDRETDCKAYIIPTVLPSNTDTKSIIQLIKNADKDEYQKFCTYVKYINKDPSCGEYQVACNNQRQEGTIFIGNDETNPSIIASLIVNQVCRAEIDASGKAFDPRVCQARASKFLDHIILYQD